MKKLNWYNSLESRLSFISILPIIGLLLSVFLLTFSLNLLSSARAYVGGESLWSKAQKEASYSFLKYGSTRSEDDYVAGLRSIQVTLGDRQAKEEMNKPKPDNARIREGFLQGGIHSDDIDGMIWLYRNFKSIGYFERPIATWDRGDELIAQLLDEADKLHNEVSSSASNAVIAGRLTRIDTLDSQLTIEENKFSSLMGEASRWILGTLLLINAVVLLGVMLMTFAIIKVLNRRLIMEIEQINVGTQKAASGEYSTRLGALQTLELNSLAMSFNTLIHAVSDSNMKLQKELHLSQASRMQAEESKKDVLNLLEDLSAEKGKVDSEIAKDEAILSNIGDGLLVIDKQKQIVLFNKEAAKISGKNLNDVIGKSLEDVIKFSSEDTGKPELEFIDRALNGQVARTGSNTRLEHTDGSFIPISNSAAPLRNKKDGPITGAIIVFRDVTKERELDKAKTEFVSLASHQLRTPLTAIGWYTEMLLAGEGGKINDEQKTYLGEISGGNKRMVDLVNSLLNVSRIDTGTFRVDPEPIDVIAMAKDVVKEIEPNIFKRKQQLIEDYGSKIPKIKLDRKLSRMILQNLLSNSCKYTQEKGRIVLKIRTTAKKLLIEVSDNGFGIPKKQQPMIFNKLFRADNVTKLDTEGTGLGLYVIKSIVEQTGGKILFTSVENKGTSFYVELPITGMQAKSGLKELGT